MANPRRRTSGFNTEPEAKDEITLELVSEEETKVEELLEEVATEMFETISHKEEKAVEEKPYVAPSITPTPDAGPRFLPKEEQPVAPRRHPRNIPKFSRHK
jgi:hypothetical protein